MLDVGQAEGAFVFGSFFKISIYYADKIQKLYVNSREFTTHANLLRWCLFTAFFVGLGFWFQEQFVYDQNTGHPYSTNTGQYLIPTSKDIPVDFRVSFLRDTPNLANKMRSKFIGE
jgi:xanthine dehydrogenase molybdopterin-binding subunit B